MTEDDRVGYKKPPLHSRFQKGQSGNPRGRPKGKVNAATDLLDIIQENVVTPADRPTPAFRLLLGNVANKALKGDLAAMKMMVGFIELIATKALPEPVSENAWTKERADAMNKIFDLLIREPDRMDIYFARLKAAGRL